jgi:nicotinate-nucleotide pyrophosphorylase (carboxylating)
MFLPKKVLEEKLRKFLEEDLGQGDVTTSLTIPASIVVEAKVLAKEAGVVAGIEEALVFLNSFGFETEAKVSDGTEVKPNTILLKLVGDARTLLSLERTLLNLLSRMSGIATKTNRIVKKIREAGYKTQVASTRKVAPGLAYFDKKAVALGGGDVHRLHLDDMVLIKDNHFAIIGDIEQVIGKTKEKVSFSKKIEVEVLSLENAVKAAEAGADIIMLDNFSPSGIKKTLMALAKEKLRGKVLVEASGGISEENVLDYVSTGVDIVSLGEITASAKSMDSSLEVTRVKKNRGAQNERR